MIVTKVRGQDKVDKIILSPSEAEVVKKLGVSLELYVQRQLQMIAKKRRWKWFFEKKENNA